MWDWEGGGLRRWGGWVMVEGEGEFIARGEALDGDVFVVFSGDECRVLCGRISVMYNSPYEHVYILIPTFSSS